MTSQRPPFRLQTVSLPALRLALAASPGDFGTRDRRSSSITGWSHVPARSTSRRSLIDGEVDDHHLEEISHDGFNRSGRLQQGPVGLAVKQKSEGTAPIVYR